LVAASGCFQYRDAAISTPVPAGQAVKLGLTDAGRLNVSAMAGEGVDEITGVVDSFSPDSVVLRVTSVKRRDISETWTRERLKVSASDVRTLSVRHFSPLRTALLVGGVALAGTALHSQPAVDFLGGRSRPTGSNNGR
jgi:hypothetical protein